MDLNMASSNPLFLTKPLEQLQKEASGEGEGHTLKRTLGPLSLVLLGIGAIIGAGLFSLTGIAAANNAGPAVTISFMVAAIGCAFAGLCYAEFASMIPIAGSAYTYSYATMGELLAWTIGWDLVLEYAVGAATVAISWSRYLVKLLGIFEVGLPHQFLMSPWDPPYIGPDGLAVTGIINLPAVFITVMMSLLLIRGTEESAKMNAVVVFL
jgi:APA family basic amino acid/polyamine antiporter